MTWYSTLIIIMYIHRIHSGNPSLLQAAKLLDTNVHHKHHSAEVVVPQLKLKDLLCHRVGELHEAALFVEECLKVRCTLTVS